MLSDRIDSIQKLEAERTRLRAEADFARRSLRLNLNRIYLQGKSQLRENVSLPKTLAAIASIGIQQYAQFGTQETAMADPTSLLDDLHSSLRTYQEKPTNKWAAFLPLIPKLIQLWQAQQQLHNQASPVHRPSHTQPVFENHTITAEPVLS